MNANRLLSCMIVLGAAAARADTIHVPADQPTIQAGIDAGLSGDEVVVAPGTYFEAINFLGKAITLRSSGGPEVTTIDGTGHFHVVQCVSAEGSDTVLDGFVITGGNADGDEFPDNVGGGMFNDGSSPTATDCWFIGNTAGVFGQPGRGAGMYNGGGSPTVTHCWFIDNVTIAGGGCNELGGGGGDDSRVPGDNSGAGMFNNASNPTVTSCSFIGNSTGGYNGVGGGMYNDASNPAVTNCSFIENIAGGFGAGMANVNDSNPAVTGCSFIGNRAGPLCEGSGGGMGNRDSNPTVTNCSFVGNSGGRWYGMANEGSSPTLTNCIFRNGGDREIEDGVTVTYSNVQGGFAGTGNIDAAPLFVDPDNGDYRLGPGSPGIDAGDNTAVPLEITTDLDGNPRFHDDPDTTNTGIVDGRPPVDMGAYEFQGTVSETVCPDDPNDFLVNAFIGGSTSGDALDLCADDDNRLTQDNSLPLQVVFPFAQIEFLAHTSFVDGPCSVTSVIYSIQAGVTALVSGGQNPDTLRTSIRRYANGGPFVLVDQRATASAFEDEEIMHTQIADACDFIQAGDGEISAQCQAFDPGDALNASWQLRIDLYEVTVNQ